MTIQMVNFLLRRPLPYLSWELILAIRPFVCQEVGGETYRTVNNNKNNNKLNVIVITTTTRTIARTGGSLLVPFRSSLLQFLHDSFQTFWFNTMDMVRSHAKIVKETIQLPQFDPYNLPTKSNTPTVSFRLFGS
jgi:hypothetical protein